MDAFNRSFVLTFAVMLAVIGLMLLAAVAGVLSPGFLGGSWIGRQIRELEGLRGADQATAVFVLILTTAGAVLLAALELSTRRREVTTCDVEGLRFGISRDGIARIVEELCAGLKGVDEVRPRVTGGSRGLRIECAARLQPRFNPVDVSQRLRSQVKGSLESTIGIPVREIIVHVHPPVQPPGARGTRF